MKICGPKFALFGLVISAWGVVQLFLMGIFFFMKSVALIEDLPISEEDKFNSPKDFYIAADHGFTANAYNCWIAMWIYVLTLALSAHQFYMNSRSSLAV